MWNVAKTDQSRSMRKVVKQLDLPLRVLIVLAPKTIERLLKKTTYFKSEFFAQFKSSVC